MTARAALVDDHRQAEQVAPKVVFEKAPIGAGPGCHVATLEGEAEEPHGAKAPISNPLTLLVENLIASVPAPVERPPRHNPKPAGVPRPGGAPAMVLDYLKTVPGLRTHAQIAMAVNGKRKDAGLPSFGTKAISWALVFLKSSKLIDGVTDGSRNSRYLRYRIAPKKEGHHHGK